MSAFLLGLYMLAQASSPAAAVDCGSPPVFQAGLPAEDTATAEQLRDARTNVQAHSTAVTQWLSCMDQRSRKVFSWLTEDQRSRWDEDLAAVHNDRVELERGLNNRIRAYNARLRDQPESGS